MTRQEFFDTYKDWAILTQARSGIPASITLAQGAIESDNGNSWLARNANNYFGIKDHKGDSWFGEYVIRADDNPDDRFRKYKSVYDSFIDHADFLVEQPRYNSLFENTDYKKWAYGLKQAGYATSSTYATDLINIIEKNGLEKYDREGDIQMQTLPNTIIRNRKKLTIITIVIAILLIALYFVGKKIFK